MLTFQSVFLDRAKKVRNLDSFTIHCWWWCDIVLSFLSYGICRLENRRTVQRATILTKVCAQRQKILLVSCHLSLKSWTSSAPDSAYKTDLLGNPLQKVSTIFPFEQVPTLLWLEIVFCIEILTSRNVNVDRLTREYFDEEHRSTNSNRFFTFSI